MNDKYAVLILAFCACLVSASFFFYLWKIEVPKHQPKNVYFGTHEDGSVIKKEE